MRTQDRPPDSRNTEAAVAAVREAARAVLLSGTPSLSRPYDLFRQVAPRPLFCHVDVASIVTQESPMPLSIVSFCSQLGYWL